jgi:hypothetical protein
LVEDFSLVPSPHSLCTGHEGHNAERVGSGGKQHPPRDGDICGMDCILAGVELAACQKQIEIKRIDNLIISCVKDSLKYLKINLFNNLILLRLNWTKKNLYRPPPPPSFAHGLAYKFYKVPSV